MKISKKFVVLPMLVLMLAFLIESSMFTVKAAGANARVLDYSGLEKQIGIANGLEYYEYTKESWEVLSSMVEAGNKRLGDAQEQSKLDAAAQNIQYAIENLVKMDYSPLLKALDMVYARIGDNSELHDVWYRLDKAVDKARPLLVSGDQKAVNDMALLLNEIMEELSTYYDTTVTPDVIVKEVEVEVPPASDFCNIPKHRTWPILFVVSASLNVLLFAILGYVLVKRHNTMDNTPLVNYDIEDDATL